MIHLPILSSTRHIDGFTLIELLVAIALTGIVAGLGGIQLYGVYERSKVDNVKNEITTALDRARTMALSNVQIYADPTSPSTCTAAYPTIKDVGVFLHDDAPQNHHHIHLRYMFNCDNVSPTPVQGWLYYDTSITPLPSPAPPPNTTQANDYTENDLPSNVLFTSGSLNQGVFFKVTTGVVDYQVPGSIPDPRLSGHNASRLAKIYSTSQGLYTDICVYVSGQFKTMQSDATSDKCTAL